MQSELNHTTATNTQLSLGQKLRAGRAKCNLSLVDVALRLNLKPYIVESLENETFDNTQPLIYMQGYLRSYARLINLPAETLHEGLEELKTLIPVSKNKVNKQAEIAFKTHRYQDLTTYIVTLFLITLVFIGWKNHASFFASKPTIALQHAAPQKAKVELLTAATVRPPLLPGVEPQTYPKKSLDLAKNISAAKVVLPIQIKPEIDQNMITDKTRNSVKNDKFSLDLPQPELE
jgi:cytoskeletal protein RodZ